MLISIHLMLMLIQGRQQQANKATKISIHLMLMLISLASSYAHSFSANFNTSHVNVNR